MSAVEGRTEVRIAGSDFRFWPQAEMRPSHFAASSRATDVDAGQTATKGVNDRMTATSAIGTSRPLAASRRSVAIGESGQDSVRPALGSDLSRHIILAQLIMNSSYVINNSPCVHK